jgi:hypothetical protein
MIESKYCKVKSGWAESGRACELLCVVEHGSLGQSWAVVIWDGEDEPDLFKAAGLELDNERQAISDN